MPESAIDSGAAAFLWACQLDVQARKPGNVSLASPGHGMSAALFTRSAHVAATPLFDSALTVGERIEAAMRVTWAEVGCNTNLGIVLLCAPLAVARQGWQPADGETLLRQRLAQVLGALDVADARHAYAAIALAQPAGLGAVQAQDVAAPPTVGLRAAMALAASRDRIASQFAHDYRDVFELGVSRFASAFHAARQAGTAAPQAAIAAMQRVFLAFLAAWPDSHIERKHGAAVAHTVMNEARIWAEQVLCGVPGGDLDRDASFAAWDDSLKARGLNPGTSADLSVASALIAAWLHPAMRLDRAAGA